MLITFYKPRSEVKSHQISSGYFDMVSFSSSFISILMKIWTMFLSGHCSQNFSLSLAGYRKVCEDRYKPINEEPDLHRPQCCKHTKRFRRKQTVGIPKEFYLPTSSVFKTKYPPPIISVTSPSLKVTSMLQLRWASTRVTWPNVARGSFSLQSRYPGLGTITPGGQATTDS